MEKPRYIIAARKDKKTVYLWAVKGRGIFWIHAIPSATRFHKKDDAISMMQGEYDAGGHKGVTEMRILEVEV